MKSYVLFTLFTVSFISWIQAQTEPKISWVKTYNGPGNGVDYLNDALLGNSNNLYLAGRSSGQDLSQDLLVLKYSPEGDLLLELRYNYGNSWDEANSIALDSDSNIYIAGSSTFGQSTFYALIHKYSVDGNTVFEKNFNDNLNIYSNGARVILNSDEDVIFGYDLWYSNNSSANIAKYSSSGDSVWSVSIKDDTSSYNVNYLVADNQNNIYALLTQVYQCDDVPCPKLVVVKINNSGDVKWRTNSDGESPHKLILDYEQNLILISQGDGKTIKINPNGEILWINDFNNAIYKIPILRDLVIDSENNIIVTGYAFQNSWDYATKKINPSGEELWMARFNSPEGLNDFANGIAIDKEDNLYITGGTHNQVSIGLCYTIKYNSNGEEEWVLKYDPPGSDFENGLQLFTDDSNSVYVGGTVSNAGFGPDLLAFKINYDPGLEIKQFNNDIPNNYFLSQNYPNPFNPKTTIEFSIPTSGNVKIGIYDVLGNLISELLNQYLTAGNYSKDFIATNLSSGVYFYRIQTGDFLQVRKMIITK